MSICTNNERISDILYTDRLRIVPLSPDAFAKRLAAARRDNPERYAELEELQERMEQGREADFYWYTDREIYLADSDICIGSVALMSAPLTDPEHLIEVGYGIDAPYRCHGYMKEALARICEMVERVAGETIDGMIAGVQSDNLPSQKVLAACGFVMTDESERLRLQIWKRIFQQGL